MEVISIGKKLTDADYKAKLKELCPTIISIEPYVTIETNIKHKCLTCGNIWTVRPNNILHGNTRCPKCSYKQLGKRKRYTHQDYLELLRQKNLHIAPLEEYKTTKIKIRHRCLDCGHEWFNSPEKVLINQGCPECVKTQKGLNHRKTHEQFVNEIANKNDNIQIVGRYQKANQPIECKCKVCGFEWNPIASNILNNSNCPQCSARRVGDLTRRSQDDYLSLVPSNINVIDTYINSNTPILHQCKECGYKWKASPSNIINGTGCPNCHHKRKLTVEDFYKRFKASGQYQNIMILSEFVDSKTKIKCQCKKCGYKFETSPYILWKGGGCRKCATADVAILHTKTNEQFLAEIKRNNPDIEPLEPYNGATNHIKCQCIKCGFIWKPSAQHIASGNTGCPQCSSSKGEKRIAKYLSEHDIAYIPQYRFEDCRDRYTLPFDFFLQNNSTLIEYQGEQHYRSVEKFGGDEAFIIRQQHDKIKREYATNHHYNYVEIAYYDYDNIEQILSNILNIEP